MKKEEKIKKAWAALGFEPDKTDDDGFIEFDLIPNNFDIGDLYGKHHLKPGDTFRTTLVRPKSLSCLESLNYSLVDARWEVVDTWNQDRKIIVRYCDELPLKVVCEFQEIDDINYSHTLKIAKLIASAPNMLKEMVNIFESYDKGTDTFKRLEGIIKHITA